MVSCCWIFLLRFALLCSLLREASGAGPSSAFGKRQGSFQQLNDEAADGAGGPRGDAGDDTPTTAKNAKTGQVISGRRVCAGTGGSAIICRRVFVITFSTKSANTMTGYTGFGPGNCYYLASAAKYALRPFVLGWQKHYYGHIMRLDAYITFLREFSLADEDVVLFTDGRDALFRCGSAVLLQRFDAAVAKQTRRAEAAGRPAGPLVWGADATCIPGFCAFDRRKLYPEGKVRLPNVREPSGFKGSVKFLNAGAWMGRVGYARRYFEAMRAHCGWRARDAAHPDKCVMDEEERCKGDRWCAGKHGQTNNDQGIVSEAFIDALNGTFAYPALIDTDMDVLLTGWNCPIADALASRACVVHLNGGFNLGWLKDKEREAQQMHVPAFDYAHVRSFGRGGGSGGGAVRESLLRVTLALEGEEQPLRFADICAQCLPPPHSLNQKMMKRACGDKAVQAAVSAGVGGAK